MGAMKPPAESAVAEASAASRHRATDKQRGDEVNRNGYQESAQVKCGDFSRCRCGGARKKAGGQEIDWIPNAGVAQNAVKHRQDRHGNASSQPPLTPAEIG